MIQMSASFTPHSSGRRSSVFHHSYHASPTYTEVALALSKVASSKVASPSSSTLNDDDDSNSNMPSQTIHRRDNTARYIIVPILSILPFVTWNHHDPTVTLQPPMAYALQEKNEALW